MITRTSPATALILVAVFTGSAKAIVTSDALGSHATTPGETAFGVNVDGVALIASGVRDSQAIGDLTRVCSGALISGRHILSAASCYDKNGDGVVDSQFESPHVATFELADRTVMMSINAGEDGSGLPTVHFPDEWSKYATWQPNLAVIELQEDAPAEVPRYPLYGGTGELGRYFVLVDYGTAGYGASGLDEAFDEQPTKRAGLNRYERHLFLNGMFEHLVSDFDSGLEEHNTLAPRYESDFGFGDDEVLQANPGGATFIGGVLAGVPSGRVAVFSEGELHHTWGDQGWDLPISNFQDFIDDSTGGTALFISTGDFDHDGMLGATDIDLLQVSLGIYEETFDLNLDKLVSDEDRRIWVEELANTFFGDADLNKKVDFADFLALSDDFGGEGGWANGDFDGDGNIAFPDFLLLSANFGEPGPTAAAVPEPTGVWMAMFAILGVIGFRRRR